MKNLLTYRIAENQKKKKVTCDRKYSQIFSFILKSLIVNVSQVLRAFSSKFRCDSVYKYVSSFDIKITKLQFFFNFM